MIEANNERQLINYQEDPIFWVFRHSGITTIMTYCKGRTIVSQLAGRTTRLGMINFPFQRVLTPLKIELPAFKVVSANRTLDVSIGDLLQKMRQDLVDSASRRVYVPNIVGGDLNIMMKAWFPQALQR